MKNLKKIKGDASYRKFFRKRYKNFNSIIVFSKKEKFKNLLVYDAINKILNKNKILAPKLYNEKYDQNYLEIEDFGNDTIFKILKTVYIFIYYEYRQNSFIFSLSCLVLSNIECYIWPISVHFWKCWCTKFDMFFCINV